MDSVKNIPVMICILTVTLCLASEPNSLIFKLNSKTLDSLIKNREITIHGDLSITADNKYIDFGSSGCARIDTFCFPTEKFTIEAKIFLRAYGSSESNYCVDIINNCTWNNSYNEGFTMRIGGGHFFPLFQEEIYINEKTVNFNPAFSGIDRSLISHCIGEISFGTGQPHYKELYTNRGIHLFRWYHYVFTWDGKNMKVFLNGFDVSDTWRIQGTKMLANIKSKKDIYFGIRNFDGYDTRHFNGLMEFVNIYDYPLCADSIVANYFKSKDTVDTCETIVTVKSPKFGDTINNNTKVSLVIESIGACDSTDLQMFNKKIVLVLSSTPLFDKDTVQFQIDSLSFSISDLKSIKQFISGRYMFWKFMINNSEIMQRNKINRWSDIYAGFYRTATSAIPPVTTSLSNKLNMIQINSNYIIFQGSPFKKVSLYTVDGKLLVSTESTLKQSRAVITHQHLGRGVFVLVTDNIHNKVIITK